MLEKRQSYPPCVNTCIANTMAIAGTFGDGCSAGDTLCLCSDANFGFAMRDCGAATCNPADAAQAVAYVIDLCAGAAASATGSTVSSLAATASSLLSGRPTDTTVNLTVSSGGRPTTYTTFTTTGIVTLPVSGELEVSTYTYVQTVTDLSVFEGLQQQTLSTSSTDSATSPAAQTSATAGSGGDINGDGNSGLTTGAKIGIGVGVSLGVLFVLGIAGIVFWRSRRKRRQQILNAEPGVYGRKAELHNENLPRTHGRSELSEKRAPVELDGTAQTIQPQLVGDREPVAELRTDVTNADSVTQSSALGKEASERHI